LKRRTAPAALIPLLDTIFHDYQGRLLPTDLAIEPRPITNMRIFFREPFFSLSRSPREVGTSPTFFRYEAPFFYCKALTSNGMSGHASSYQKGQFPKRLFSSRRFFALGVFPLPQHVLLLSPCSPQRNALIPFRKYGFGQVLRESTAFLHLFSVVSPLLS